MLPVVVIDLLKQVFLFFYVCGSRFFVKKAPPSLSSK